MRKVNVGAAAFGASEFQQHPRLTLRGLTMERYIHEQNLLHYRKVLADTTDPTKRRTVLKLLADEQARFLPRPMRDELTFCLDFGA